MATLERLDRARTLATDGIQLFHLVHVECIRQLTSKSCDSWWELFGASSLQKLQDVNREFCSSFWDVQELIESVSGAPLTLRFGSDSFQALSGFEAVERILEEAKFAFAVDAGHVASLELKKFPKIRELLIDGQVLRLGPLPTQIAVVVERLRRATEMVDEKSASLEWRPLVHWAYTTWKLQRIDDGVDFDALEFALRQEYRDAARLLRTSNIVPPQTSARESLLRHCKCEGPGKRLLRQLIKGPKEIEEIAREVYGDHEATFPVEEKIRQLVIRLNKKVVQDDFLIEQRDGVWELKQPAKPTGNGTTNRT